MSKPRVAFLCTHNACRSQMAEAMARLLAADVFESFSAGTAPGTQINPDAARAVERLCGAGMDREQHPKTLAELPEVDVVVTMGCGVRCPYLPCRLREDWGLEDPTGQGDAAFDAAAQTIRERVLELRRRLAAWQTP